MLMEGCSGGGVRYEAGMMYYTPQIWCSDDTDAIERLDIQYGTSFCYPVSTMGAHVSACPNHQTGRSVPLRTRATVAMAGTFGYELDLNLLSEEEMAQVKEQVAFMKKYRRRIQVEGDFYRLLSPFKGNETAWIVVSPDKNQAVAAFYQRLNKINASWLRFRLEGLDKDTLYEVK